MTVFIARVSGIASFRPTRQDFRLSTVSKAAMASDLAVEGDQSTGKAVKFRAPRIIQ